MKRAPPSRTLSVCLTGGIACGKSLIASFLAKMGVPVIEADLVCHELMKKGRPAHAAIVRAFGADILGKAGEIDRATLGRLVFDDPARLAKLNGILHPSAKREIAAWLASGMPMDAPGVLAPGESCVQLKFASRVAVAVVPLVYEAGWEADWDIIICVFAPLELQRRRMKQRGLDAAAIRSRLAAQWPVQEKARRADAVIFNSGSPALAVEQARNILELSMTHGRVR